MNLTPTTVDREDRYPASQSRGRHARPAPLTPARPTVLAPARPSRARRYLIGAGVTVVGGAAVVAGLMATSSSGTGTNPGVQPASTATTGSSGTHTANPAVPSRPDANPAVPSRPNAG